VARRRRERNRVRAQERLRGERGNHGEPGPGETGADHVVLHGLHGVVADRSEVSAVGDGHHADAHVPRFVDREPHRPGSHDDAEPTLGVDHRSGRRLADNSPSGTGIQLAGLVVPDVRAQHIRHAMRLDTAEICHRQHVRRLRRIFWAHAELLEDLRDRATQRRFRDEDLIFRRNLEPFKNHRSLLGCFRAPLRRFT